MRNGIARSVISLCSVLCLLAGAATAQQLQYRTWTDDSGKFRVEAALITVKDGTVYLERKDGVILEVPLSRLSDADRARLGKQPVAAPKPAGTTASEPPGKLSPDALKESLVLIEWKDRDDWRTSRGVLLRCENGIAYVAGGDVGSISASRGQAAYRVVFRPGTADELTVDAERLEKDLSTGIRFWKAAVETPIKPLPLDKGAELEGEVVEVVAIGLDRFAAKDGTAIVRRGKAVRAQAPGSLPSRWLLSGDGIADVLYGPVLNEQERLVGVARAVPGRRGGPEFELVSVKQLTAMFGVTLDRPELDAQNWGADGIDFQATFAVNDPLKLGGSPQLLIARCGKAVEAKFESPAAAPAMPEMAMVESKPWENPRGLSVRQPLVKMTAAWHDPQPLTAGELPKYLVQLRVAVEAGKFVYSPPVLIDPYFARKSLQQHVLMLGSFKQELPPHPRGGLLLTTLETKVPEDAAAVREKLPADAPRPVPLEKAAGATGPKQDPSSPQVGPALWSRDGQAFFWSPPQTTLLRRLSAPQLEGVCEVDFGAEVAELAVCRKGLLALTKDGRLWLLDENTLEARDVFRVDGDLLAASAAHDIVFVCRAMRPGSGKWSMLDVALGKMLHQFTPRSGSAFKELAFAAEGRSLLGIHRGAMFRFRLEDTDLIAEERGGETGAWLMTVDGSGKTAAVAVTPGSGRPLPLPLKSRGVYVYDVGDLSRPRRGHVFDPGAISLTPHSIALGAGGDRVFAAWQLRSAPAADREKENVAAYDNQGQMLYRGAGVRAEALYLHPDGKGLYGQSSGKVFQIDLPATVFNARPSDAPATAAPEQESQRLQNVLRWETVETGQAAKPPAWQPLADGIRGAPLEGMKVGEIKEAAWSADGKTLFVRSGVFRLELNRIRRDDFTITHRVQFARDTVSTLLYDHRTVFGCRGGLLVRRGPQLVLADAETLQPLRIVFDGLTSQQRVAAAAERSQFLLLSNDSERSIRVVDIASGKTLDEWKPAPGDSSTAQLAFSRYFCLTPDGRHLFVHSKKTLHFTIDDDGKIERKADVAVGDATGCLPFEAGSSQAVVLTHPVKRLNCISAVEDPSNPVAATDSFDFDWFHDPRSGAFCSVSKRGEIVGYNRAAKEVFRVSDAAIHRLEGFSTRSDAIAPPDGGGLLLAGAGWYWIDLSQWKQP